MLLWIHTQLILKKTTLNKDKSSYEEKRIPNKDLNDTHKEKLQEQFNTKDFKNRILAGSDYCYTTN